MFYNSGTWVYALGTLILLVVSQWLGARIRPEMPTTKDSPAVENSEEGAH